MARKNLSRLLKQCTLVFLLAALAHNAFAQDHGKVFPITTTATSYSTQDNSYEDGNTASGVRLVFAAPKTGLFKFTFDATSSDYYVWKCTDDTYASCGSYLKDVDGTSWSQTISVRKGDSVFYLLKEYNYPSATNAAKPFEVSYSEELSYVITIKGAATWDTAVSQSTYSVYINAVGRLPAGQAFVEWKLDSGTGTFSDSSSSATYFYPSSDAVISIDSKPFSIYALGEKNSSFTYDVNGVQKNSYYEVATSYSVSDTGCFALLVKTDYTSYIYAYGTDGSLTATASTLQCNYSDTCRYLFCANAGESRYFGLVQTYSSNKSDIVTARVAKAVKISADTAGYGYVRVAGSSYAYDSTHIAGDSVSLIAYAYSGAKFNHWEKVSGKCSIVDSTMANTSVVPKGDCRVKAVFTDGPVFSITSKSKNYSLAKDYYSQSATSGVRFMFVAPDDGAYAVQFKAKDVSNSYTFTRYLNSFFNTSVWSVSNLSEKSDSLYLSKNDTVFYTVNLYSGSYDSLFSVKYSTLKSYKITLTSASKQCSTSVSREIVPEGVFVSYVGYSIPEFRPGGFVVKKGKAVVQDSLPASITLKVSSDVSLELQCESSNLLNITNKKIFRIPERDFYEMDPSSGLRFRYIAPTTDLYAIRATAKGFSGSYQLYGSDSLFSSAQRTLSLSPRSSQTFYITPQKGDILYFKAVASYAEYYDDSVAVYAIPGASVEVEGKAYADTVAVGDSLAISVILDSSYVGYHFVSWKVSSGAGVFKDSSLTTTYFIPSTTTAKVSVKKKKVTIYPLTDKFTDFTYKADGAWTPSYEYGVWTVYTAKDTGMYVLLQESLSPWYVYDYYGDSTFSSSATTLCYNTSPSSTDPPLRSFFNVTTANSSRYFFFRTTDEYFLKDTIRARVVKTAKVRTDTVGGGAVYIAGSGYSYDSTHIAGDTLSLTAAAASNQRFDHWAKTSGKCTILDSTARNTQLVIKGDCNVRAYFRDGIVYPITATPTSYTIADDYYVVDPTYGVWFSFKAPSAGVYAIVTSWTNSNYFQYYRYDSTNTSYSFYRSQSGTIVDTLVMDAGDSVTVKVYAATTNADSAYPFWISYSTSKVALELVADSNGSVSPRIYDPAWKGSKYFIGATANIGYRFDSWELAAGSSVIDDRSSRNTLVTVNNSSKYIAHFRKAAVQKLTKKVKTFNYLDHYYSDRTGSAVYFTWTPPDTSWYMVHIESTEKLAARWYTFGTDTTFLGGSYSVTPAGISGTSATFSFQSTAGEPIYWALIDSITSYIPDQTFTAHVAVPYILTVSTEPKGRVNPSGQVGLYPGTDTAAYAMSYGGYVFDKWVVVSGKADISDPTSAKIRVKPKTDACEIKATYTFDLATEPELSITGLDLSDFPGICASVIVKDKNTGKSIAGLDSNDFVLFQDSKALPVQVSSTESSGGVSVAIVVDESGSMDGTRMIQAQESIRKFIEEMSAFDRTAIVGFDGYSATVHQAMTSDRSLLLAAVSRLDANGNTNILNGAYTGLEQIVGETNPTAVIIFSDGGDNSSTISSQSVIDYAKSLNTVIHSVAVGSDIKDPLKTISDGTGGSYTYAPTADQLASIYISIRNSIQATYSICYESPDTVVNGDDHEVVVKTKFLNKTASDTAYWSEKYMPPVVKLTKNTKKLIGVKQTEGDSLVIKVYVTSVDSIASVMLYMRTSSPNASASYSAYQMTHEKDSLWSLVIPGSRVVAPGIDFYVIAKNTSGLVGKSPQVSTPSNEPYTIPVGNYAPTVEYMPVTCVDTTEGNNELTFTIKDDDGINTARFYYRSAGSVIFTNKKMTHVKKSDDWTVTLPASAFGSDKIEFYVRAIDKKGVSARWEKFTNTFVEACRDSNAMVEDVPDTIKIVNGEKEGKEITRLTESISLSLVTEDFTSKRDTVTVSLSCLVSGDVESTVKMVEVRNGYYETQKPIAKNEYEAKKNDGKISCAATDTLVAVYKDPLYGTYARDSVFIGDDVKISYQFMDAKCKTDLDSVQTSTSANFCLKVFAPSPSLYDADTLKLTLFTDQGDSIRVEAVETDDYSLEYTYKGTFYFVEDSASLKKSHLDAVLDLDTTLNRVVIQGGESSDKSKLRKRDSLVVYTKYAAADFAEIYDRDLDGRADSVRIHFKKPLKKKIASIDTVFWNVAQGSWTDVDKKKIYITEDSTWAEARVRKAFKYGLTAPDTSAAPYLRVTKDKSEFSQKTMLLDRVGAVPVRAVKRPGQISMVEYLDASDDVAPDTLEITMSESIKNMGKTSAWKDLFRYAKTCEDTVYKPIRTNFAPIVDSAGLVWKFVLADYAIMKDYCIMTNPKASYVDSEGNSMGRGGVKVEGRDETVYLYEVSAQQPVHGIGKKQKWIPQGGDSWEDVPDSLSVVRVASVSPYEATIHIYDNLANVVTTMKQKFGYNGEMEEAIRGNEQNRAKLGFLVWNHRSNRERKVGTGVYIWRIDFKFKDGHTEYRILKTGYLRRE